MADKTDKLINQGDQIINDTQDTFINDVRKSELLIFEELIQILSVLTVTNGKLQTNAKSLDFLLALDKKIISALTKADYKTSVADYLKNFDIIAQNSKAIQDSMNGLNIATDQLKPIINIEKQNTLAKLTSLDKDFIAPLRETIYRNIYFGADITTVEKTIRDFVISKPDADSRLIRYLGQVSTDAVHQFDGTIQAKIGEELNLKALRYIGSLIKDSRGQCVKWVEENHGILLVKNLQEEIDFAYASGSYHGHRIGGMIPGTTPLTFPILRGGYFCRHRVFFTKV